MTMLTAVLLSATLSAVVAIAVTLVIERWGGRIGGVLGTIPTTIVPAGIGLALASDAEALSASLAVVPYGMLINGCFLLVYVLLPPRLSNDGGGALVLTTTTALVVWSAFGALILLVLDPLLLRASPMTLALVGTLALAVMGVLAARGPRPAPAGHRSPVRRNHGAGSGRGHRDGLAVYLSGLGLPLLAGLSSVFPAIFLTTMVGLWVSQGPDVPLGAAGPMLLVNERGRLCVSGDVVPTRVRGLVGLGGGVGLVHRRVDPALFVVGHALGFSARSHSAGSGTPMTRSSTALMPRSANSAFRGPQGHTDSMGSAGARVEPSAGTAPHRRGQSAPHVRQRVHHRAGPARRASAWPAVAAGHVVERSCLWLLKLRFSVVQTQPLELPFGLVEMRLTGAQEFRALFEHLHRGFEVRAAAFQFGDDGVHPLQGFAVTPGFHSWCSRPVHVLDRGGYRAVGEVDQEGIAHRHLADRADDVPVRPLEHAVSTLQHPTRSVVRSAAPSPANCSRSPTQMRLCGAMKRMPVSTSVAVPRSPAHPRCGSGGREGRRVDHGRVTDRTQVRPPTDGEAADGAGAPHQSGGRRLLQGAWRGRHGAGPNLT